MALQIAIQNAKGILSMVLPPNKNIFQGKLFIGAPNQKRLIRMRFFCLQLEASCLQWSFFTYSWQL